MRFIKVRLQVIWKILTQPKLSWAFISLEHPELVNQIMRKKYTVDCAYHRLQDHNVRDIGYVIASGWDREREWAQFEIAALNYQKIEDSTSDIAVNDNSESIQQPPEIDLETKIQTLENKLRAAIQVENYELAQEITSEIERLKSKL